MKQPAIGMFRTVVLAFKRSITVKSNNEIHTLFEKYLVGSITGSELQLLLDHFDAEEVDDRILQAIRKELASETVTTQDDYDLASSVKLQLDRQLRSGKKVKTMWWYLAAAVAIVIAIAIATVYYLQLSDKVTNPEIKTAQQIILPGSDKAILILSDGRKIELSESTNETIEEIGGNATLQVKEGAIKYQTAGSNTTAAQNAYHTIAIPQGGQFKVILPDGSIARLNAGSSLRYPVSFGTSSRKLELIGEGYFEVVKNKKLPFTVKSGDLEVTALGTQFNVNTYSNEPYGAATLVEGSLRVSDTKLQKSVVISPGQQAYSMAGQLKVRAVNSAELTAWKDGLFVISKAGLDEVMRQVERWYNVTVDVKLPKSASTFSGEFPRNIELSEFLKSLETATGVKLKIEGRRIVGR